MGLSAQEQQKQVAAKKARMESQDKDGNTKASPDDLRKSADEIYKKDYEENQIDVQGITAAKTAAANGGDVITADGQRMSAEDYAKDFKHQSEDAIRAVTGPKSDKDASKTDKDYQAKGSQFDQKATASPEMDPKHRPAS